MKALIATYVLFRAFYRYVFVVIIMVIPRRDALIAKVGIFR